MLKINKILYATDFSKCASRVLPHALYLMKKYNAELHMLHAIIIHADNPHDPAYYFTDQEELYQKLKENAYDRMKSQIEFYDSDFFKIIKVQKRGNAPAPVILDYSEKNDIDLILMGAKGERENDGELLGNVAEEVVRCAKCSILTINDPTKNENIETKKNILVPMDFSLHSKIAIEYAKEIALTFKARLQLLHIVEDSILPSHYKITNASNSEFLPAIKNNSKKILRKYLKDAKGPDIEANLFVVKGCAVYDIVKFAKDHQSDLIVLASHGLTGKENLHQGIVSEKVVRTAECPVFTVKAFGKSLL